MRIGIDLMGGENPPEHLFQAVLQAAKKYGALHHFVCIATPIVIEHLLPNAPSSVSFKQAFDVIGMEDSPLTAIRRKKDASILVGIQALKEKGIDAFISCGNTGALVAAASLFLPKTKGIKTLALLALLPTEMQPLAVLDVGGHLSMKPERFLELALMGAEHQRTAFKLSRPRVGLLNIGTESKKGTTAHREAYKILEKEKEFSFVGNIEARDIFKGEVDVLVTDGFTGNVLLKTSEGVGAFIFDALSSALKDSLPDQLLSFQKKFNYREYPGARICGVEGVVIKAHGNVTASSLMHSIEYALSIYS